MGKHRAVYPDAFEVLRYVSRRMRACRVSPNARSYDTPERIVMMAHRALLSQHPDLRFAHAPEEELGFVKSGEIWVGTLEKKGGRRS